MSRPDAATPAEDHRGLRRTRRRLGPARARARGRGSLRRSTWPGAPRCARTVAETTEVMAAMATDLPRSEPSAELRDRLRAAVAETEQVSAEAVEEPADRPARDGASRATARSFPRSRARSAVVPAAPAGARARRGAARRRRPWASGTSFLADSRDDLQATVAQQQDIVDERPARARAGHRLRRCRAEDGTAVATVVARGDEVDVISTACRSTTPTRTTYVLWGLDDGDRAGARHLRRDTVTDGREDRRLRARPVSTATPGTGSASNPVGRLRRLRRRSSRSGRWTAERTGDGRSRSSPSATGRPATSGSPGTTPTTCTACGSGSPRPGGGGGWPAAARSTTATGSASGWSAA